MARCVGCVLILHAGRTHEQVIPKDAKVITAFASTGGTVVVYEVEKPR